MLCSGENQVGARSRRPRRTAARPLFPPRVYAPAAPLLPAPRTPPCAAAVGSSGFQANPQSSELSPKATWLPTPLIQPRETTANPPPPLMNETSAQLLPRRRRQRGHCLVRRQERAVSARPGDQHPCFQQHAPAGVCLLGGSTLHDSMPDSVSHQMNPADWPPPSPPAPASAAAQDPTLIPKARTRAPHIAPKNKPPLNRRCPASRAPPPSAPAPPLPAPSSARRGRSCVGGTTGEGTWGRGLPGRPPRRAFTPSRASQTPRQWRPGLSSPALPAPPVPSRAGGIGTTHSPVLVSANAPFCFVFGPAATHVLKTHTPPPPRVPS